MLSRKSNGLCIRAILARLFQESREEVMVKRTLRVFIALLFIAVVMPPWAQAENDNRKHDRSAGKSVKSVKSVKVNLRFAGAAISDLAQGDNLDPVLMFQVQAKGKPGSATVMGINQGDAGTVPAANLEGCFEGANLKLIPTQLNENSMVATFKDLSVLNMARDETRLGEDFVCIRFFPFRFDAVVSIKFTGGFGRFEGASGEGTVRLESKNVIPGSPLISEIGTLKGTVVFDSDP